MHREAFDGMRRFTVAMNGRDDNALLARMHRTMGAWTAALEGFNNDRCVCVSGCAWVCVVCAGVRGRP